MFFSESEIEKIDIIRIIGKQSGTIKRYFKLWEEVCMKIDETEIKNIVYF